VVVSKESMVSPPDLKRQNIHQIGVSAEQLVPDWSVVTNLCSAAI
jgi:hypothetical protein